MYNDTVTLFCRCENESGIQWYPKILHNVNLNIDKATIVAKYGAESKDNAVLNVRYRNVDGKKMICDKEYLLPKEWRMKGKFDSTLTFSSGQKFDFFYVGTWENEEPVQDDAYGIDGFYDYMNRKYDFVFAVTSVATYSVIPHFEITGK